MFGFILIYHIGNYFYQLAKLYDKSKWVFAILGVLFYYASLLISGILIVLLIQLFGKDPEDINDFMLGLFALPFGIFFTYLLYKFLERKWEKAQGEIGAEIDLIGEKIIDP